MVVFALAPLSVTNTPLVAGVTVPEIENAWAPVKLTPVALVPERVMDVEIGVNAYPAWLGGTTYEPLGNPANVKLPDLFVATVVGTVPVRRTEAPAPAAVGEMLPDMLSVPLAEGRISTAARFHRSVVGEVSSIAATVPAL